MNIELVLRDGPIPRIAARTYDPDVDDVRSILADLCEAVAPRADFRVMGFGRDPWPVDVRTDLAVFLEQLPSLMVSVVRREAIEVDFYEQGIERAILFEPDGEGYRMTCASRTCRQPDPAVEWIERDRLLDDLHRLKAVVLLVAREAAPDLLDHPWMREWRER